MRFLTPLLAGLLLLVTPARAVELGEIVTSRMMCVHGPTLAYYEAAVVDSPEIIDAVGRVLLDREVCTLLPTHYPFQIVAVYLTYNEKVGPTTLVEAIPYNIGHKAFIGRRFCLLVLE